MTWIYRLTDGQFLRGGWADPSFDPESEGRIELASAPDYRVTRGSAEGARAATIEEIAAFDAAMARQEFDSVKALKAMAAALWKKQTGNFPSVAQLAALVDDAVIAYKNL